MKKESKKAKKKAKNEVYHFPLRLSSVAREQVTERAKKNKRSMNGQINFELTEQK